MFYCYCIIVSLYGYRCRCYRRDYGNNEFLKGCGRKGRGARDERLRRFPFLSTYVKYALSGIDNFIDDIEFMCGTRPSFYWRFCWGILTPISLFVILIYFLISMTPLTYNDEYYPDAAYGTFIHLFRWKVFGIFKRNKKKKRKLKLWHSASFRLSFLFCWNGWGFLFLSLIFSCWLDTSDFWLGATSYMDDHWNHKK